MTTCFKDGNWILEKFKKFILLYTFSKTVNTFVNFSTNSTSLTKSFTAFGSIVIPFPMALLAEYCFQPVISELIVNKRNSYNSFYERKQQTIEFF